MAVSHDKGEHLESQVALVLEALANKHPQRVQVLRHPRIELQNGETIIPDFDLQVTQLHECSFYFIECQDRKRSSKELLHKIQHVRNKHWRKTFLFVYVADIPAETERALGMEGVIHVSFSDFKEFIGRLSDQLDLVGNRSSEKRSILWIGHGNVVR